MKSFGYFRGFFPMSLPRGVADHEAFCTYVFNAYGIKDAPSYRSAISTMILHLSPTTNSKAPYFFAKSIFKAQANEVAFQYLDDQRKEAVEKVKQAKIEAQKLDEAAKAALLEQAQSAVTPKEGAADNVISIQQ